MTDTDTPLSRTPSFGSQANSRPPGLFITGTDTGVGKTHVTCLIARQAIKNNLRVAAYKPTCSGAIQSPPTHSSPGSKSEFFWEDIERLKEAVGGDWPEEVICPQRFLAPLAPPIAARLEGKSVDFEQLVDGVHKFQSCEMLLIEGAGGWLSPITETQTNADLALALNYPILIVGRVGLGTINHTLLTVESIRSRGLHIAGIVLNEVVAVHNDESVRSNGDEIEARSGVPVFGTVPYGCPHEFHRNGVTVTINWPLLAGR